MDQLLGLNAFDLDRVTEMDENFLNVDEEHVHDQRVSSIGFVLTEDQQINLFMLQRWIGTLIQKYNLELFRYKGVIAVKGMDQKFVFQGVHMLFGGDFAANWGPNETRKSVFCFIGKDLAKMGIKEGFEACIAKPVRWKVGHRVECRIRDGYSPGTIIKLWDEGNAYRVRLDQGMEVWAPIDEDVFVRDPKEHQ